MLKSLAESKRNIKNRWINYLPMYVYTCKYTHILYTIHKINKKYKKYSAHEL